MTSSFDQTNRDQMQRLTHLIRRALRYSGLAILIVLVGAAASVAFALSRAHGYESETTLLHRQLIPERVIRDSDIRESPQELAARYEELAISRDTLRGVIDDLDLLPGVVERHGMPAAIEEMRERVDFADRGAGAFRVSYIGDTPDKAERVTAHIADLLIEKDDDLRREQVEATNDFLRAEKQAAEEVLGDREEGLAAFLADNPEFAGEVGPHSPQGAWTRALQERVDHDTFLTADAELGALQRQRDRLQARLDEPDEARDRERRRAESRVDSAEADLESAQSELQMLRGRYTDRHPDVLSAERAVGSAERRLRDAESELPPGPPTGAELVRLHEEMQDIEGQIASRRAELQQERESPVDEDPHWVVELETEFAGHLRDVEEARERVDGLEHRLFTAEIQASSKTAASSQLVVIDQAFEPAEPVGRSRRVIAAAGTMLFGGLAIGVIFGLAILDDRIYGRGELDRLGIGSLNVVVPQGRSSSKRG